MAKGGCHCGAIRYETTAPPERNSICHCIDCRRASGAPLVAWALYAAKDVKVTKGAPKVRASSEHGRRHFCAECGTGLFYTNDMIFKDQIDVTSATLDNPDDIPPPAAQVQVAERIGWLDEGLRSPEFRRYPGME
jgi:hypothetical protein